MESEVLKSRFDLAAAPEPWLPLTDGGRPLLFLTTNPGATLDIQRRAEILTGRSIVSPDASYADAAAAFAAYYTSELRGPARRRVNAMRQLAVLARYAGARQVECVPFHSASLPGKETVLRLSEGEPLLADYMAALRAHLQSHAVVAISAVPSRASLVGSNVMNGSPWLQWQAALIGLVPTDAEVVPLVRKGAKVTCAALVGTSEGHPRALVLMMGSNQLPGSAGLHLLADSLRK